MSSLPDPNLIRRYVDGELSPEQEQQVKRELDSSPEIRETVEGQIGFEQALRDQLRRVMQEPVAPRELRRQVTQVLAEVQSRESARPASKPADFVGGGGRFRLAALLRGPARANAFMVAATLAVVAAAVLWGVFGRSIDDVRTPGPEEMVAAAAVFADQEHDRFAPSNPQTGGKLQISLESDAQAALSRSLGRPVPVFDLTSTGYRFHGAGLCAVPVPEKSAHLMYSKPETADGRVPRVSIFIFPKRGCCSTMCQDMALREWYPALSSKGKCRHTVLRSTDGELVYLLVCCNEGDLENVKEIVQASFSPGPQ